MTYRVYFNQHSDFPLVGSIDTGDDAEELNVETIEIIGVNNGKIQSHYRPERQPKFWLEVEGELKIVDGHAVIIQQEML
jgi:hypothetical protein